MNTRFALRVLVIVLVLSLLAPWLMPAPVLAATYITFNVGAAGSNVDFIVPGPMPNVTISNLTRGPGLTHEPYFDGYSGHFLGSKDWTISATRDADDYMEFTITPASGYGVVYTSLSYSLLLQDANAPNYRGPRKWELRYSTDGFTSVDNLLAFHDVSASYTGSHELKQLPFTDDISAIGTQTGMVTFRLYGYDTTGASAGSFAGVSNSVNGPAGGLFSWSGTGGNIILDATVIRAATSSIVSSPNPSVFGQSVTFTATVTANSGTPTGNITFTVDTLNIGPLALTNGVATYVTNTLAVGTHPVTVTYSGDANYPGSSGTLSGGQVVIDSAITDLTAVNDSPTRLTEATFFTATISSGSNVTYQWKFGDGQMASGAMASHTYAAVGNYTALVTATNGVGSISASTLVTITNQAPIANAGSDQSVLVNALVSLDGSGSTDPDGHLPLTYGWTQSGGPAIVLSRAVISRPTFTAPSAPAVLTFTLNVTDAQGLRSATGDSVVITVGDVAITGLSAINSSPTRLTDVTYFTATISTGSNVIYQWNFGDGQTGSGANSLHTYANAGNYTAIVTATNSMGSVSASTRVTITNQAPIANAGSDQSVLVNAIVTLDGSGSTDPDGHLPLTYGWTQSGGPTIRLSSAVISRPTFIAPSAPAVLTFTLIVTDAYGASSAPARMTVIVDDHAITNLQASNNSPTRIGNTTSLTATITAGSNALYTWDFGDGHMASGVQVNHRYAQIGTYTATVTATNGVGSISATTLVTIERATLYLPLIARQSATVSALVVADLMAVSSELQSFYLPKIIPVIVTVMP